MPALKTTLKVSAIALVAAGVTFGLSFDALLNRGSQKAVQIVNQSFPGKLSFEKLKLRSNYLELDHVTLASPAGETMAQVDHLLLTFHPTKIAGALTDGEYDRLLQDVTVDGFSVYPTIDAYGQFNFAQLSTKKEKKPFQFNFADYNGKISFNNGRIVFKDERDSGFLYELRDCSLNVVSDKTMPGTAQLGASFTLGQDTLGKITLSGQSDLQRPLFKAEVGLDNVELKRLAEHPLVKNYASVHDGVLDGQVWAVCSEYAWEDVLKGLGYGGKLKLSKGLVMANPLKAPVRQIEGDFKISQGIVNVERLQANLGGMGVFAKGSVSLFPQPRLDILAQIPRFRAKPLEQALGVQIPVQGQASVELKAEGTLAHPCAHGNIKTDKLVAADQSLNNGDISFSLQDKILSIDNMAAQVVGGQVQGCGYVFLGQDPQLIFNVQGHDANLAGLSPLGGYIQSLNVGVVGSLKDPTVFGSASGIGGFSGQGAALNSAAGSFCYQGGQVSISGQADTSYGSVQMPYGLYSLKGGDVYASVATSGFKIPTVDIPGVGPLSGTLVGSARLSGKATDLNSFTAYGTSQGTSLDLDSLHVGNLSGSFAFNNMLVYLPMMLGNAAGGTVAVTGAYDLAGGPSGVSMVGTGMDIAQVAGILDYNIPVELGGVGELGLNWNTQGMNSANNFSVYADSEGGKDILPFLVGGYGHIGGSEGLGVVAWTDGLTLQDRKLTNDLHLQGNVIGKMGAWQENKAIRFAYGAYLENSPLQDTADGSVLGLGGGSYEKGHLELNDNVIAWNYRTPKFNLPSLLGGYAYTQVGPLMGSPLEEIPTGNNPMPGQGYLAVKGGVDIQKQLSYDLAVQAYGARLGWLRQQTWLPQVGKALEAVNVRGGYANMAVSLKSDHGLPRIGKGSWFESPFFIAGPRSDAKTFSLAGSIWSGPNSTGRLGAIHLDPLVISARPFDTALPAGSKLAAANWFKQREDGWVTARGFYDNGLIDLHLGGSGWDMGRTMAFLPQSFNSERKFFWGSWRTDDLRVAVDLNKGINRSLCLNGDMYMDRGYLTCGGQQVPVQNVHTSISQLGSSIVLNELSLDSGPLHLQGRGQRDANRLWSIDLWANDFPLKYLSYWNPEMIRFSGDGDLALSLRSEDESLKHSKLYMAFVCNDADWFGHPYKVDFPNLTMGRLHQEGDMLLTGPGEGICLALDDGRISLDVPEGAVDITSSLEGSTTCSQLSKLTVKGGIALEPDLSNGAVQWFTGPKGPIFGSAGQPFEISAVNYDSNVLRALFGLAPTERHFSFSGTLGLRGQWYAGHMADSNPDDFFYSLGISKFELGRNSEDGKSWNGLVLKDDIKAYYRREGLLGRLVVDPFELVPHSENVDGGLDAQNGVAVPLVQGSVRGHANMVLTQSDSNVDDITNDVALEVENLPMSELSILFKGIGNLGYINKMSLKAVGSLLTPDFRLAVDMAEGGVGKFCFSGVEGLAIGSDSDGDGSYELSFGSSEKDKFRIYLGKQKSDDSYVDLLGYLPFHVVAKTEQEKQKEQAESQVPLPDLCPVWKNYKVLFDGKFNFGAKFHDQNLGFLSTIIPGINKALGLAEGDISLQGTLDDPVLKGSINLIDGSIDHDKAGRITDLNLKATFSQLAREDVQSVVDIPDDVGASRIQIEQCSGKLSNVPFNVGGHLDFAGPEPVDMEFTLKGDKLPVQWGDLFKGIVDVDLAVDALPGRYKGDREDSLFPVLTGNVYLESGDVSVGLDQLTAQNYGEGMDWSKLPLDYRLCLRLSDDVWINAFNCGIKTAGELWVVPDQKTHSPVLAGAVDLSRGTLNIPLYESPFKVRRGKAVFESSLNPILENVEAETEVSNYQITAYVSGALPDVNLQLVSNPHLEEREIQRLLAFGTIATDSSNYDPVAAQALAGTGMVSATASSDVQMGSKGLAVLSRILAAPLTQGLGRVFTLTDCSMDFMPPNNYSIKIAKALDHHDKILFVYTRGVSGQTGGNGKTLSTYGLEWRFRPGMLVRMAYDQDGYWRPWFQGLWTF